MKNKAAVIFLFIVCLLPPREAYVAQIHLHDIDLEEMTRFAAGIYIVEPCVLVTRQEKVDIRCRAQKRIPGSIEKDHP